MSLIQWQIPPSVLGHLSRVPSDRAVVVLLRHSVRDDLPPGDAGYQLPINEVGHRLASELGKHLRGQLQTLHASPLPRCIQTAKALGEGAGAALEVMPDRLLGDPGIFVLDNRQGGANWKELGHEGVMHRLVTQPTALPGMARPDEAARFLVQHMLAVGADRPGIHVFVTHDSVITATAARLLGHPLGASDWPWYLEGAFFWRDDEGVNAAYRQRQARRGARLCEFTDWDVIEFARREIAATVGLDSGARFFLAGGAFKSLLTGRAPRDLDLWAPSADDRQRLVSALRARGAQPSMPRPFADAFEIDGRLVEVPHKVAPSALSERLDRFDIGLSAVGVEHLPRGNWSAAVHPLATESVQRGEVLLLKPLANWKFALATLERMRRYAVELGFSVPSAEEAVVWDYFDAQSAETQMEMIERYRCTGTGGFGVLEEATCRCQ